MKRVSGLLKVGWSYFAEKLGIQVIGKLTMTRVFLLCNIGSVQRWKSKLELRYHSDFNPWLPCLSSRTGKSMIDFDSENSTLTWWGLIRIVYLQVFRFLFASRSKGKAGDLGRDYSITHSEPLLHFALCSGNLSDPSVSKLNPLAQHRFLSYTLFIWWRLSFKAKQFF